MIQDSLARVVSRWRVQVGAVPDLYPGYEREPVALLSDRVFKKCLKLAGWLGLKLDLLAALSGTDKFGLHNYTSVLDPIMRDRRRQAVSLLEIGVGGFDANLGGESLLMWAAYFSRARIFAVDIVDKTALSGGKVKVFQCSQTDRVRLTALAGEIGPFDFIIDDGSHVPSDQIESFRILWPFLKDGGAYVIEDVQTSYWPYYGGGNVGSVAYDASCVNFFKKLADSVNYPEFLESPPQSAQLDRNISSVAFHHNLIVLTKDMGERRSNFPIQDEKVRAGLMTPGGGTNA
jgi:hypothetical protein